MEKLQTMSTRNKIVMGCGTLLLLLALCLIVAGGSALVLTGGVTDAGNAFMSALRDGDYDTAYTLASPTLQADLGSADALQGGIERGQVIPTDWSFSSRNRNNNEGDLSGSVTFASGSDGRVALRLVRIDSEWRVEAIDLEVE